MNTSKITARMCAFLFAEKGGRHVVISPGSRNAPLTIAFQQQDGIECHPIPDERSAGFVALGLAQATNQMVGLCCTSGTALTNYAPALIEASLRHIPLVVFSADRPEEWIGQEIGQSIQQPGSYGDYIKREVSLQDGPKDDDLLWYDNRLINEALNESIMNDRGPVHINLGFREPLYERADTVLPSIASRNIKTLGSNTSIGNEDLATLQDSWNSKERRLIICGELRPNSQLSETLKKLEEKGVVILHETHSNLFGKVGFSSIDRIIEKTYTREYRPDLVISLGHHIISKRIKKFIQDSQCEHWTFSRQKHTDTFQRLSHVIGADPVDVLAKLNGVDHSEYLKLWKSAEELSLKAHASYLEDIEFSDLKVFENILNSVPEGYHLELGNSSIVRYGQLFPRGKWVSSYANRGTSGIEGSTSTALGIALGSSNNTLLITGDISFFYDSNALWNENIPTNLKILVVNNGGGGIFRYIAGPDTVENGDQFLESQHQLSVRGLVEGFGVSYLSADSTPSLQEGIQELLASEQCTVLEVFTPRERNDVILRSYFEYIRTYE